ncbi:RNA polymerase sigma factor [Anaeromyxobacter diazotrophicus]|uniref:RNA polymerase sigma factor n=1 Tax=Anaeromyxobacter diazotrophicus TaxID=2590199 RepID=UPI001F478EC2|nr:sigma-70 family RNA polymerase sigma factor [Anaeromyxobacter diazotrophicus]
MDRSSRTGELAAGPSGPASDAALLQRFAGGEEGALAELFRRHERLVLDLVRRYARTPDDARDLAQRTFVRALQAARGRRLGGREFPFRRWLVRVAVNLAKNHVRDRARLARASVALLATAEPAGPAAIEALEQAERARAVRGAVLRLPRRQREVLTLRVDAELPFAEIAAALGISENAAKVHFHHATRALRASVAPREEP